MQRARGEASTKNAWIIAAIAVAAYAQVAAQCLAGEQPDGSTGTNAPERQKLDLEFKEASAHFPEFCRHWEQNLREREQGNLSKLQFTTRDGYQTATYTGYGGIETCEAHQSKEGFAIGKIVYYEFTYYLAGRTREEAVRGEKREIGKTRTIEIFRWEDGKWF